MATHSKRLPLISDEKQTSPPTAANANVISTEATDGIIVRRAVERPLYWSCFFLISARRALSPVTLEPIHHLP